MISLHGMEREPETKDQIEYTYWTGSGIQDKIKKYNEKNKPQASLTKEREPHLVVTIPKGRIDVHTQEICCDIYDPVELKNVILSNLSVQDPSCERFDNVLRIFSEHANKINPLRKTGGYIDQNFADFSLYPNKQYPNVTSTLTLKRDGTMLVIRADNTTIKTATLYRPSDKMKIISNALWIDQTRRIGSFGPQLVLQTFNPSTRTYSTTEIFSMGDFGTGYFDAIAHHPTLPDQYFAIENRNEQRTLLRFTTSRECPLYKPLSHETMSPHGQTYIITPHDGAGISLIVGFHISSNSHYYVYDIESFKNSTAAQSETITLSLKEGLTRLCDLPYLIEQDALKKNIPADKLEQFFTKHRFKKYFLFYWIADMLRAQEAQKQQLVTH